MRFAVAKGNKDVKDRRVSEAEIVSGARASDLAWFLFVIELCSSLI
jgi:hypothetical protein